MLLGSRRARISGVPQGGGGPSSSVRRDPRDPILDRLPGSDEIRTMCTNAKRVARVCELLGVGLGGEEGDGRHLGLLASSRPGHLFLEELGDDDDEPFIWDT